MTELGDEKGEVWSKVPRALSHENCPETGVKGESATFLDNQDVQMSESLSGPGCAATTEGEDTIIGLRNT